MPKISFDYVLKRGDGACMANGNHDKQIEFTFNRGNAHMFFDEKCAIEYAEWLLRHGKIPCDHYKAEKLN